MWQEENIWLHYVKNIIAADVPSAVFLSKYLGRININKSYCTALEVVDLQKYRVIKKKDKVRAVLSNIKRPPFIFIVGKN